jgi:DNA-binding LacI/PurR family transcriptional regulator
VVDPSQNMRFPTSFVIGNSYHLQNLLNSQIPRLKSARRRKRSDQVSRFPNRRVSIKDVASTAGVSLQTVSRVVNGSEQVAAATRERVLEVIQQLGYRRNEVARNLIQGRSRTLGVICAGLDYFGGRQINGGITAEAQAQGYSLLLKEHQAADPTSPDNFVQSLLDRQVDGFLWMLTDDTDEHDDILNMLVAENGPPVVAMVNPRESKVPFAAFDNFGAGMLATQHLIDRGHRKLVHIAGPKLSWESQERIRGWRAAMAAAGLPSGDERIFFGNWGPEGGEAGLRELVHRIPDLDAVFAGNDNTALGGMYAALQMGKRIPEDIAFVGVDGIKGGGWFYPPLTTIRQNRPEMGRQAIRMLSHLIEARFAGTPVGDLANYVHPPELIVRASS